MIHLEIKTGSEAGRRMYFPDGRLLIGRGPYADLSIEDDSVSLRHAELWRNSSTGRYLIRDVGSTNGTRVGRADSRPIEQNVELANGDWIWVGNVGMVFQFSDQAAENPSSIGTPVRVSDAEVVERAHADDISLWHDQKRHMLHFLGGVHRGRVVLLGKRPVRFGASFRNEVVLADPWAEELHFMVRRQDELVFLALLHDSRHPPKVNGRVLTGDLQLEHRDLISVGSSLIEYLDPSVSHEADVQATLALSSSRICFQGSVWSSAGVRVGRDPSCEIFVDTPDIEREAAWVQYIDGSFWIRAIGSASLIVDERPVVSSRLEREHVVALGSARLELRVEGPNCFIELIQAHDAREQFAYDRENASPYQTMYRVLDPVPSPETAKRPRVVTWSEPWDVRWSAGHRVVIGSVVVVATLLLAIMYAFEGGGAFVGQKRSSPHATAQFSEKIQEEGSWPSLGGLPEGVTVGNIQDPCVACHTVSLEPTRSTCVSCHEIADHRPAHVEKSVGLEGKCTACHSEHFDGEAPTALIAGEKCAGCHPDRHEQFRTQVLTVGALNVARTGLWVPNIRADLAFDAQERTNALHRRHESVPNRCNACHVDVAGVDTWTAYEACLGCHDSMSIGLQEQAQSALSLASLECAACHREHGAEWTTKTHRADDLSVAHSSGDPSMLLFVGSSGGLLGTALAALLLYGTHENRRRRREEAVREAEREKAKAERAQEGRFEIRINAAKCVPIGSCVKACPYHVLEMAPSAEHGGRTLPKVAHLDRCKLCRACEDICGVKALSIVPIGEPLALQVLPDLDVHYESNVPGLFVIGEASGKPLVKNANNLGFFVIHYMISRGLSPTDYVPGGLDPASHIDVLIVGAGPAGLSAAISAKRAGLSAVILEQHDDIATTHRRDYPRDKMVLDEPEGVENIGPLPVGPAKKEELISLWRKAATDEQISIIQGASIERIARVPENNSSFSVSFADRKGTHQMTAQRVVIAIGARGSPRKLGVPGEDQANVFYSLTDAEEYRNSDCVVVGAGDSALEAAVAIALAQKSGGRGRLALVVRADKLTRGRQETRRQVLALASEGRLALHFNATAVELTEQHLVISTPETKRCELAAQNVFCLLGSEPTRGFLENLGIAMVQKPRDWDPGATDELIRKTLSRSKAL